MEVPPEQRTISFYRRWRLCLYTGHVALIIVTYFIYEWNVDRIESYSAYQYARIALAPRDLARIHIL